MKFTEATKIHFIGIGGIGMSSIAQIIQSRGVSISGSDNSPSEITESLKKIGDIFEEHNSDNISESQQLVVFSPAIPENNPEIIRAKELNIRTISYSQALGELSEEYFTIAISGTHGKSTTTAMTALAIEELDPTVVLGTKFEFFNGTNFRVGKSKYLLIEACEYKETFLTVHPNILVITNIEVDHLDYFKTEENYVNAYRKFAKKLSAEGTLIINSNDKHNIQASKIITWNKADQSLKPQVPGQFNIENATVASTIAKELGVSDEKIHEQIAKFKGTWRRFERKGKIFGTAEFIDDYGHHPTEIKATLKALREENPEARILCVFQPHQYSRTHKLLMEFGASFEDTDEVIIPNIYKVRDSKEDIESVSTDDLVKEIQKNGGKSSNGQGLEKTAEYIKTNHSNYDIIIIMGAGNIIDIDKMLN